MQEINSRHDVLLYEKQFCIHLPESSPSLSLYLSVTKEQQFHTASASHSTLNKVSSYHYLNCLLDTKANLQHLPHINVHKQARIKIQDIHDR